MDDDLGKPRDRLFEPPLHLLRDRVGPGDGERRVDGDMNVSEDLAGFAPAPEVMVPGHPGGIHHHRPDERRVAGEVHRVGEDLRGLVEDPDPHPRDEEADGEGDDRVGLGKPEPDREEAPEDGDGDEDVAPGMEGVGDEDLALVLLTLPPLVGGDGDVDDERPDHDPDGDCGDRGGDRGDEPPVALDEDAGGGQEEHRPDDKGPERLDLAVAVGVLRVRGFPCKVDGDDPDDV